MIKMLKLLGETIRLRLKFQFFHLLVSVLMIIIVSSVYQQKRTKDELSLVKRINTSGEKLEKVHFNVHLGY